jgi:dipeptidyl aminopeptidase/acylaminoacyl peptidase
MIGKTTDVAAIANGDRMNAETLWAMGRIGGAAASPDGNTIVYQVGYYSVKQNKSHQMLYTISADGKKQCALTTTTASETDATWIDGGKRIAFLTGGQLWSMNADGTDRRQLTKSEIDIEGYIFSPDEKKVILIKSLPYHESIKKNPDDLPLASGRLVTDLNYRYGYDGYTDYSSTLEALTTQDICNFTNYSFRSNKCFCSIF